MSNDQHENPLESVTQSIAAANSLRGAIKTGKAIAGVTKGAALGGPYGAAIMGLWTHKNKVLIACMVILVLLSLPILFVIMLPSVIFGGLDAVYEQPILNNDVQIHSNIQEADQAVWMILRERHDAVVGEIADLIDSLGENERGIMTDVQLESIGYNSALILSQYSACKGYSEISIQDLAATVAANSSALFDYTVSTSTSTTDDDETITTYHYTVTYAGESYFADTIFKLDDAARKLANEYAQNLTLQLYGSNFQGGTANVSEDVLRYSALIVRYAKLAGIENYFDLICAVMMAESGGRGTDPMQSSEGPFNSRYPQKPNAIQDPEYSIECGVKELASCLAAAGCSSPSDTRKLSLALQGYNYGNGYIEWATKLYGGYSESNAIEFSNKMKAKLGWTVYGNPRYVSAVMQYYYPSSSGANGWGSPFVGRNWKLAVTSEFGYRTHPITGEVGKFHAGTDIGMPMGTPINAVKSGVVESAVRSSTGYGWHIIIDHGGGCKTLYGHCSELLVVAGQRVQQGQVIAKVGSTGNSTGPHLHLNVEIGGELQNPRNYIP